MKWKVIDHGEIRRRREALAKRPRPTVEEVLKQAAASRRWHEENACSVSPYGQGIDAGHEYFRDGVDKGEWNYPDESPYPKGSEQDGKWWNGFHHGSGDAEASYESDY